MLEIEVVEIKGKCPDHKVGDRMVIDDPRILLDKTVSWGFMLLKFTRGLICLRLVPR